MDTKALRQKILDLAIRGKLVPQDPNDEPASVLLERIRAEKQQMVKEGKLKAKDIKNDTVIFLGDDNLHYEKFSDGTVKCIEDEIPFELPEGWEWCKLYHVSDIVTGSTPSKKHMEYYGGDFPFYKPADLDQGADVTKASEYLSEIGKNVCRIIPKYSTAVCCIGTIGKCGYIQNEGTTNQQINSIIPFIDSKYMYYYCCTELFVEQLLSESSATTIAIVNKSKMSSSLIPIPPINEQHRIIERIGELLFFVDIIEFDKTDLQATIQLTKSKILDLAIRGKLVPQNPDDEPASVLLERIRAEKEELIKQGKIKRDKRESVIFRGDDNSYYEVIRGKTMNIDDELPFELADGWTWCRLQSISTFELGKTLDAAKNKGDYHNYLRSVNVRWDGVDLTDVNQMRFEKSELERYRLQKNDLLICEGGDVGRSCIWNLDEEMYYQNALHRVRFYQNIMPEIYLYIMMYYSLNGKFDEICKGVTIKHLTSTTLKSLIFPLPPLSEQKRIADKIDQLFSILDTISVSLD